MKIVNLVENTVGAAGCGAAHGLSFYIETPKHKLLMDAGPSGLLVENAAALGVDLAAVDLAVISHGHYDHADGLAAFSRVNDRAPIYIRRGGAGEFYSASGGMHYIGMSPEVRALGRLRWVDGDARLDDELFLFGGVSGRRLWPEGNKKLYERVAGGLRQDGFGHEQSLVVTAGGKTALLSGCAHCGVLNILDRCHELLGGWPDAVISGFHMKQSGDLTDAQVGIVQATARALLDIPSAYYTCHCTGLPAYEILKGIMGDRLQYVRCGDALVL